MYSLPNLLTISRILVIPVIFLSIYIHTAVWSMLAAVLFIVASITDYFDGYLARSRNETSAFGRLLDPIADKLLVASALIVILADNMVHPVNFHHHSLPRNSGFRSARVFGGSSCRYAGNTFGQMENRFSDDGAVDDSGRLYVP